jgi:hypothetical protein
VSLAHVHISSIVAVGCALAIHEKIVLQFVAFSVYECLGSTIDMYVLCEIGIIYFLEVSSLESLGADLISLDIAVKS